MDITYQTQDERQVSISGEKRLRNLVSIICDVSFSLCGSWYSEPLPCHVFLPVQTLFFPDSKLCLENKRGMNTLTVSSASTSQIRRGDTETETLPGAPTSTFMFLLHMQMEGEQLQLPEQYRLNIRNIRIRPLE